MPTRGELEGMDGPNLRYYGPGAGYAKPPIVLPTSALDHLEIAASIDAPGTVKLDWLADHDDAAEWEAMWQDNDMPPPIHVRRNKRAQPTRWVLAHESPGAMIVVVNVAGGGEKQLHAGRNAGLLAAARAVGVVWLLANDVDPDLPFGEG